MFIPDFIDKYRAVACGRLLVQSRLAVCSFQLLSHSLGFKICLTWVDRRGSFTIERISGFCYLLYALRFAIPLHTYQATPRPQGHNTWTWSPPYNSNHISSKIWKKNDYRYQLFKHTDRKHAIQKQYQNNTLHHPKSITTTQIKTFVHFAKSFRKCCVKWVNISKRDIE